MVKRNVTKSTQRHFEHSADVHNVFIFDPSVLKIDTGAYVATTQPTLTNDDVFFYVPEVIYLAPSTTGETGTVPLKWFADRENADNGEITKSVEDKTAGSVYFHCVIAESYIINVSLPDGCSISNVDTGTWTLTWSDGTRNYATTRYSRIYKTNYVPSGGAGRTNRGSSSIVRVIGAVYINGFANTFTGGNKNMKDEYNTALNPNWQRSGSSGWNEIQKYMDSAATVPY